MPRVPRRMYTEAEARAVIKRELLLRRTNDSEPIEKRKEDGDEDSANTKDGLMVSKDGSQEETKKICYLLEKLPFEVRTLIYRILFRRPTAIAPGDIRYKFGKKPTLSIYSYQWNDLRQDGHNESSLPKYDGSYAPIDVAWRSKTTLEQLRARGVGKYKKCASTGERELSQTTYKEDIDAKVKHYVYQAGDSRAQVVNRAVVSVTGIQGVALLGTCKQLLEECRAVLYGENTFAFNTCGPRGQVPYKDSLGLHAYDAFQDRPHEIPGLKTVQTKRSGGMAQGRINHAINIMFGKVTNHQPQPFMARDPLVKFFRNIGPSSASHVTSVILEGHFRTADNTRKSRQRPISFRRTLPIHSTILKNVCPKLRKLVLNQVYVDPFTALFNDVRDRRLKLTFEGRVDLVVGQVVAALPTLQVLQLGNPHPAPSCESAVAVALWGRSLRWEGVVESRYQRAEEFAEEERKKKEAEKDLAEQAAAEAEREAVKFETELAKYIWDGDASPECLERGDEPGCESVGENGLEDEKPVASRPNAFAYLIDVAFANACLEDKGSEMDDQTGSRSYVSKSKKGKKGKGKGKGRSVVQAVVREVN